jgi:lipopolysaccharide biosynthesis regulator YciM
MLLGDLHAAQGRDEEALEAWKRIENQDPNYLALVAERSWMPTAASVSWSRGMQLLRAWLAGSTPRSICSTSSSTGSSSAKGPVAAYEMVREELRRNPTLLGLDKLLEAAALNAPAEQRADIELIKQLIHGHTRRVARYRCDACGFKARQFHWRCPACGGWETYPPRRTEEFDLTP